MYVLIDMVTLLYLIIELELESDGNQIFHLKGLSIKLIIFTVPGECLWIAWDRFVD